MSAPRNIRAKRRPDRGTDNTGRSKREGRYVQLFHHLLDSDAYQALTCPARGLLIELLRLSNGSNNGKIALSHRDVADLLGCSRNTAPYLFDELIGKGFIKLRERGSYSSKGGWASEYIITDLPIIGMGAATPPTRDFMEWTGTDFEVPARALRGGRNWRPNPKPGHFPSARPTLPEGHPCTREGPPPVNHALGKGHSGAADDDSMHSGSGTLSYHAGGEAAAHNDSNSDPSTKTISSPSLPSLGTIPPEAARSATVSNIIASIRQQVERGERPEKLARASTKRKRRSTP